MDPISSVTTSQVGTGVPVVPVVPVSTGVTQPPSAPVSGPSTSGAGTSSSGSSPSLTLPPAPPTDQVQISPQGAQASQHVTIAKVAPELDSATIKKLKAEIAMGNYPPPAISEGLLDLIGSAFIANSDIAS